MGRAALVEMLVSFGIVLAIAVWDLLRTPKPPRASHAPESKDSGERAPPSGTREPRHPKR
jgi:hypothetical protein